MTAGAGGGGVPTAAGDGAAQVAGGRDRPGTRRRPWLHNVVAVLSVIGA